MTPREREFAARLCAERAGLRVEAEGPFMERALAPLARREGYGSVSELMRTVRDRADEHLTWAVVESLAPIETAFFRDPEVFAALGSAMAAARGDGRKLRVWCAAAGSGQEAYSVAILAEELGFGADVEIFASDLSERLLDKARTGLYSAFEVQQGLSAQRLVRAFENHQEAFAVAPTLRRRIRWRRVNLIDELARLGRFDVVLCRYLLHAMVRPARTRVLTGLAAALAPEGRLLLSPADALDADALGLRPDVDIPGAFRLPSPLSVAA